jgi:hypothetical protein
MGSRHGAQCPHRAPGPEAPRLAPCAQVAPGRGTWSHLRPPPRLTREVRGCHGDAGQSRGAKAPPRLVCEAALGFGLL